VDAQPFHPRCDVDFQKGTGTDALAANVDRAAGQDRKKYKEYGIKDQPFVIVKPDAGTYGTSILTIKDASEIKDLTASSATR
jgi:glutamate--cysteine ligase